MALASLAALLTIALALLNAKQGTLLAGAVSRKPAQAVEVLPSSFAVLPQNDSSLFRTDAFATFNPTNTAAPFFQVIDPGFYDILGSNASIHKIASRSDFAFAHEAPIWIEETNEIFFASNDGGALGMSDLNHNSQYSKINLTEAEAALDAGAEEVNVTFTKMTNGGTGPVGGNLLLITSGRGPAASSIVLVNPSPPFNTTVLLDNFFGRQFNSLNDIKIHPKSGKYFFTDVTYGWLNHFRPLPALPNQIYRFDPVTSAVRVVADGFDKCNGIAFTKDGKTAYIADTGVVSGFLGNNGTEPATLYQFDVDEKTGAFLNRRVFAYVDTGVADGVQVDSKGNVYAGCGDGVQVWDAEGTLLGKFFLNTTSANLVFAGEGTLVILAETAVYLVRNLLAKGLNLGGPTRA
ncbi:calcium-dependent phosphotriesterase [Punctularia strigosozonata HHB-11173 SS5]|uniref:calcium-dependent phosphotriesterase n=1 Tax=Punctularia strigosozonata (strain HHB-11173) TaxID=741275 RepID=UPI00044179FC|nr:calcium-dependent phosphotriesterase [Punctularia strigosozonata HHB-11173 SS5]EIN05441.1 calcium-dependent phosphotriesterase [Punctularia strigosozonata HHB-11173 SS5]